MPQNKPRRSSPRAEPIDKRTAHNGAVTYTFQIDVGVNPDGTRDRQRFTHDTLPAARKQYRRLSTEVAEGKCIRHTPLTVSEAIDEWLASRRRNRRITLRGYRNDLRPARQYLGGHKLATLTKADVDKLVNWMLTQGRTSRRANSLSTRVTEFIGRHPEGVAAVVITTEFPNENVHATLSHLARIGRITRPRRAVYAPSPSQPAPDAPRGVKATTVRHTLSALSMVVQSYVNQDLLPRNVIAFVERPADEIPEDDDTTESAKSWTLDEAETFRKAASTHRLYACWLLSLYGARRSEVLGMRWTRFDGTAVKIRRGRVAVGNDVDESRAPPHPAQRTTQHIGLTHARDADPGPHRRRLARPRPDGLARHLLRRTARRPRGSRGNTFQVNREETRSIPRVGTLLAHWPLRAGFQRGENIL